MSGPIQQAIEALTLILSDIMQGADPGDHECRKRTGSFDKAQAALSALQSLQGVELPEPMAWLYENHADGVQAFTNEPPPRLKELCKALYTADQLRTAVAAAMARGAVPRITPAQAMDALKEAFAADPSYAWTWHCGVWAAAHDEGMETSAANRAAARLMSMAFDVDTSKHENFAATQAAAPTPEATQPETCKSCNGEGGHEKALSSTNYTWVKCPDCEGTCKATQPTQAEAPSEREAFEAWARGYGYQRDELDRCRTGIVGPEYYNANTETTWKAWQARAALATQQAGQGEACCVNWAAGTSCFADPRQDCPRLSPMARSMDAAPRDGTMLRLLVDFDESSFEDSPDPAWTIGFNNLDNTGDDRWQFAGWCWTHDHITEGGGTPIGWLPMLDTTPPAPQQPEALAQQERDREDAERWREWLRGNALTVVVPTPTEKNPASKTTITYAPSLYPAFASSMNQAIDAAIRAARSSEGGV